MAEANKRMNISDFFLSPQVKNHIREQNMRFDPVNAGFVLGFMIVGAVGVPLYYLTGHSFHWGPYLWSVALYWVAGLGVTMGYHRFFSHRTYDAASWLEAVLLVMGSMSLQNSALKWSADHRKHHSFTDTAKDPYNAKLGFMWSHILWIFFSSKEERDFRLAGASAEERLAQEFPQCRDLVKSRWVRWQHAVSIPMGLILSFSVPVLLGWHYGHMAEYVLVAGFLRVAVVHNSTFFINSLAHIMGSQPHSEEDTSRDHPLLAILALGEGYHNYHHTYPNDFRNGIKAWHFDPTKWLIYGFSKVGATSRLRTAKQVVAGGPGEVPVASKPVE